MRLNPYNILKIRTLRKKGYSVPEISRQYRFSKSTVLRHIEGVKISPQYYQRWLNRRNASKIISERNWSIASQKAEQRIGYLTEKDLAIVGASLYWAEGSKRDFSFSNTDPEMIKVFIYILRKIFRVSKEDLKISLRIYEDLDKNICLRHWSNITGVKLDSKTSIDILKGSKNGKLVYGMCRIRVKKGGLLLNELFSIVKRIDSLISPHSLTDKTRDS